jgi:hypothetical protein
MRHVEAATAGARAGGTSAFELSKRDLVVLGLVLLLPVPLFALSGLHIPLPEIVQRAAASLLPGVDFEPSERPVVRGSIRLASDDTTVVRATAAGPVPAPMLFGRTAPRAGAERREAPDTPRKRTPRRALRVRTGPSPTTAAPREHRAPARTTVVESVASTPVGVGGHASEDSTTRSAPVAPAGADETRTESSGSTSSSSSGGSRPVAAGSGSGAGSSGSLPSTPRTEDGIAAEVPLPGGGEVSVGVGSGGGSSGSSGSGEPVAGGTTIEAGATLPGGTTVSGGAAVSGEGVSASVSLGGSGSSGGSGSGSSGSGSSGPGSGGSGHGGSSGSGGSGSSGSGSGGGPGSSGSGGSGSGSGGVGLEVDLGLGGSGSGQSGHGGGLHVGIELGKS